LAAAGVESPVSDARLLLEAAAGASRADILAEPRRPLSGEQEALLEAYLARRETREPVSRILGVRGFWKLMLRVNADVLSPRPESETILDAVLPWFEVGAAFTVLDLGVGSGALLLAMLAERPAARGLGVDVSEEALAVARDNAAHLGLAVRAAFLRTDWTSGLADHGFDLVVANPPYIPSSVIAGLAPEVRDHDPRLALDGGLDGLAAYRELAPQIMRVLKAGARFALEFGPGQASPVAELMAAAGAVEIKVVKDLGDRDRVLTGSKKALG
jgi:release factor glutamine methyltransferase